MDLATSPGAVRGPRSAEPGVGVEPDRTAPVVPEPDRSASLVPEPDRSASLVPEPDRTAPVVPEPDRTASVAPEPTDALGAAADPGTALLSTPAEPETSVRRPGSEGEHEVQRRLGTTKRADRFYSDQMLDHLNERMQEFVQRQEMFFLATADRHGECDSTFRAGPPGFLQVLDARTLVYPEYRGNGVHASLGNIQENPHLGILLMDFQQARIGLHINGRAEVVEDAELRAEHPGLPSDPVPGRRAQVWVRVEVEEAYIHCAKHIPHLQKAPGRSGREWGTDDYKRKGGDFFGTARDARRRRAQTAASQTDTSQPAAREPGTRETATPERTVPEPVQEPATREPTPTGTRSSEGEPGTTRPVPSRPDTTRPDTTRPDPSRPGTGFGTVPRPARHSRRPVDPATRPSVPAQRPAPPAPAAPTPTAPTNPRPTAPAASTGEPSVAAPNGSGALAESPTTSLRLPAVPRRDVEREAPVAGEPAPADRPRAEPADRPRVEPADRPRAAGESVPPDRSVPSALPVPVAALAGQPESAVWVREAQRALDEAQRRGDAAMRDEGSFQGWFG